MPKMLPDEVFESEEIQNDLDKLSEIQEALSECDHTDARESFLLFMAVQNATAKAIHDAFVAGMNYKGEFDDEDDEE